MDPFVIEETNGLKRAIVLRGTSRPFKPIDLGVEMRMETTFYPGNKVGFQRVSGAKFVNLVLTGRWDDKRMGRDDRPQIVGFGELLSTFDTTAAPGASQGSAGMAGGQVAQNTAEICAVMQSLLTAGSRLRVEWGRHVRYGRLKRFSPRWKTRFEVEWEAEFEWIGDQADQPVPAKSPPNVAGFLDNLQTILGNILSTMAKFAAYLGRVEEVVGDLAAIVQQVIDAIGLVIDTTLIPQDALGSVRSAYERIRVQCEAVLAELRERTAGLDESLRRDPDGAMLALIAANELERFLQVFMEESMLRQAEIDQALGASTLATYVANDWESLRDVAIRYYGTPDAWQSIAEANSVSGSIVRPGTELRIPKLT